MRALNWLWRGLLFFILFAFALNNQHLVELKWVFGWRWQAPMVFVVLAVFALGCITGVLAMLPSWWRHRRTARNRQLLMPDPVAATTGTSPTASVNAEPLNLPSELPFPPDMPAPRKPVK
ncbi:LapA family protein [Aquabacterium sp. UBA2148]|uniref:LapA family protein n=1 Tax=Aquabacterium sp. UBA2148 TaxID=1946042 RepID=UPI00257DD20F|nr:LapA family protein [Aquabacterium sp. UBA2148]